MRTDATGASIVIEFTKGRRSIYDNTLGVITNSPTYDWHTTNVRNYIGLNALNSPSVTINKQELSGFGQGTGAIGLPGDFTPASRFVRALFLSATALKGNNSQEGVDMAFKILNSFDIPAGVIREFDQGKQILDVTQWTSVADLKNKRYYFHTIEDRSIRMVDLKELQGVDKNIQRIKVTTPETIQNLTPQLMQRN